MVKEEIRFSDLLDKNNAASKIEKLKQLRTGWCRLLVLQGYCWCCEIIVDVAGLLLMLLGYCWCCWVIVDVAGLLLMLLGYC